MFPERRGLQFSLGWLLWGRKIVECMVSPSYVGLCVSRISLCAWTLCGEALSRSPLNPDHLAWRLMHSKNSGKFAQPMKDWMDGYVEASISASCTVPVKWKINSQQTCTSLAERQPCSPSPGLVSAQVTASGLSLWFSFTWTIKRVGPWDTESLSGTFQFSGQNLKLERSKLLVPKAPEH